MSGYWMGWAWDFPHIAVGLSEFVLAFCVTWRLTHPRPPARHESRMTTGEDGRDYRVTDTPTTIWRNDTMGYTQLDIPDARPGRLIATFPRVLERKELLKWVRDNDYCGDRWQVTDD